ncbi:hypothetical protein DIS24_g11826 [Lasiodiplodia hormozganensis]|uniref:Uncharacterized protein n=1 Tax=Lasiodiplodia hormozganensis TaxID=869390 RepID=A0AA39WHC8_9PEZI|nr:hypothetical protein DIS24_g11826 [Lasiodiplodia hormozganensis]
MPNPTEKPVIMLLSLNPTPHFATTYSTLLTHLSTHATTKTFTTAPTALAYLTTTTNNPPSAILITDAAFLHADGSQEEEALQPLLAKLTAYVRAGGSAVFCCRFPRDAPGTGFALDRFFPDAFGLPWRTGGCHHHHRTTTTTTTAPNGGAVGEAAAGAHPRGVESVDDLIKRAIEIGRGREKLRLRPARIEDLEQREIAVAEVGRGWVEWVRDVDAEEEEGEGEEEEEVILGMCGF